MKLLLRTGMIVLASLISSLAINAQSNVADFSGNWGFKSGRNDQGLTTIQINQSGPQIEVTEKYEPKQKRSHRILTYFSDARGESNESFDGKYQLNSRTKWTGNTLFTLFERHPKQSDTFGERYDEWSLSQDGQTLTIATTFKLNSPASGLGPLINPRSSSIKTHDVTLKRVFKKRK